MTNAETLVGRNIVAVTREPYEGGTIVGFVLDDDTTLFSYSDAEGNGPGAMMILVMPANGDPVHFDNVG